MTIRWAAFAAVGLWLSVFGTAACHRKPAAPVTAAPQTPADSAPIAPVSGTSMTAVRFLEDRVKSDPDDLVALNKLANYYLQLYRETYNAKYLELALRSAHASLNVLAPEQNLAGLDALAQAEYATHDFNSARNHATELIEYQPGKVAGYLVLGDALLELGDYSKATAAYEKVEELDHGTVASETRLARLAFLRGDLATAQRRYAAALAQAKAALVPTAESIAWCYWQSGETAFQAGDYAAAEQDDRDALAVSPNYVRAMASLGRVRAALADRAGAIEQYEHAVRIMPDPLFVAALGDLYKLADRAKDATRQYALVEQIGRLNELNGVLYNRQLALFYADHDLKLDEAYAKAAKEYAVRRDVYGADAVAWTAFKAGKLTEAQTAMNEALRLGTKDARMLYHAGMIARAAGNRSGAHDYLARVLALNPQFDPLLAPFAVKAAAE